MPNERAYDDQLRKEEHRSFKHTILAAKASKGTNSYLLAALCLSLLRA